MPLTKKQKRMHAHIVKSELKAGKSLKQARKIADAVVYSREWKIKKKKDVERK